MLNLDDTHTHTHSHTHFIFTYIHTHTHTQLSFIEIHVNTHTHTHTEFIIYVINTSHTHTHTHTHIPKHIHIHKLEHNYTHTHSYTPDTFIHTHSWNTHIVNPFNVKPILSHSLTHTPTLRKNSTHNTNTHSPSKTMDREDRHTLTLSEQDEMNQDPIKFIKDRVTPSDEVKKMVERSVTKIAKESHISIRDLINKSFRILSNIEKSFEGGLNGAPYTVSCKKASNAALKDAAQKPFDYQIDESISFQLFARNKRQVQNLRWMWLTLCAKNLPQNNTLVVEVAEKPFINITMTTSLMIDSIESILYVWVYSETVCVVFECDLLAQFTYSNSVTKHRYQRRKSPSITPLRTSQRTCTSVIFVPV